MHQSGPTPVLAKKGKCDVWRRERSRIELLSKTSVIRSIKVKRLHNAILTFCPLPFQQEKKQKGIIFFPVCWWFSTPWKEREAIWLHFSGIKLPIFLEFNVYQKFHLLFLVLVAFSLNITCTYFKRALSKYELHVFVYQRILRPYKFYVLKDCLVVCVVPFIMFFCL